MILDPISLLSIAMIQIGSRHLSLNLTEYQKGLMQHPITQMLILFCIVYVSTKDPKTAAVVVMIIYLFIYIVFNEEHELSIITKDVADIRKNYNDNIEELDAFYR